MNTYALICNRSAATTIVDKTQATTQAKATRRLFRANNLNPKQAAFLGYKVEFQKPVKED